MLSPHRGGRRDGAASRAQDPPDAGSAVHDAEPDPESVARAIALRLLATAPRSRAQLASAMSRRNVSPEVAASVLDRFEEVGLVNDAAYAEMLVRTRHAERGLARRALAQELRERGIAADLAESALEAVDGDAELAAARDLVRRRAPATVGLDTQLRRRRLATMLARRGYGADVSIRAVDEVLAGEPEDAGVVSARE